MRHTDIRVGDRLRLKRDNPYGLGPLTLTVTGLTFSPGYKVPYVRCSELDNGYGQASAFKPSDFQGRA